MFKVRYLIIKPINGLKYLRFKYAEYTYIT
jgi:hypothetical protein